MSKTNRNEKLHLERDISRQALASAIVAILVVGFTAAFAITAFTPLRYLIPGYPSGTVQQEMKMNAMKIDSLQRSIFRWRLYTDNLLRELEGGTPVEMDSLTRQAAKELAERDAAALARADSILRQDVTEQEKFVISEKEPVQERIEGLHFFKPLNGTVSHHYEVAQHPYLDITAPEGSTVKSVLDGSVVYTGWTETDGWCMVIQHQSGILSVYKHNRSLMKKTGDKVGAGTAIAQLGAYSGQAKGTHLHFELWQDGTPVDPAEYIAFQL